MDDDEETESVTGSSIAAPSSSLVKEGLSPIHALSLHQFQDQDIIFSQWSISIIVGEQNNFIQGKLASLCSISFDWLHKRSEQPKIVRF